MRRKLLRVLAPVGVLSAAGAVVFALYLTKPEPEKNDDGPRPVALFVSESRIEDVTLAVRTQGEVRPRTEIDLVAQVSGRIVRVSPRFVAGGSVEAGATLIKIEDIDYRLDVTRAESRVAEAKTQIELREASAEIARRNWDDTIVGKPSPLAMKQPQLAEARAKLRAADADLAAARLSLGRTNVSVPFDGRVRNKTADIGQYVTVGMSLGRVYSTDTVEVRLPLTDRQLATLELPIAFEEAPGEGPRVSFDAIVAGESRHWHGRVVRTEAAMDTSTRMLYAIAEVEAPYGRGSDGGVPMLVGLFVNAEIEGRLLRDVQVIPRAALRENDTVYVIRSDNTLDIRTVSVIHADHDRVVVGRGIRTGEAVVVSAVRAPRQGMEVVAERRQATRRTAAGGK